ncbi:MAG: hypothetical protein KGQ61_10190 [Planctomycetes bacterium]|nr:hypothetical protein [Planctomycetota bacterium]
MLTRGRWQPIDPHSRSRRDRGVVFVVALVMAGCGRAAAPPGRAATEPATPRVGATMSEEVRTQLLSGAIDVLGKLDDYDEGAATAQVFDRLNQWSHAVGLDTVPPDWRPDELVGTISAPLADEATLRGLGSGSFDAGTDIITLRDQRWLADVAATARRDAVGDLEVARNLFDWTCRTLAITTDPPAVPTEATPGSRWFLPGEILLAGRASAPQRMWVFLELLRHAALDGVVLATGDASTGQLRPWAVAVIAGGEAYVFDPLYGLAVPGPGGTGVATARQAAADPSILASLSLPDRPYPVQAADIERLTVLVPAAPWNLARRMARIDAELVGTRRLNLSIDASALAQRASAALPGGAATRGCRLWEFPWVSIARRRGATGQAVMAALGTELGPLSMAMTQSGGPRSTDKLVRPLFNARLREFRGDIEGPDGAKSAYLLARPSTATINAGVAGLPPEQADVVKRSYERLKEAATYFLGVLTLGERDYETAVDYLGRMTLEEHPDGIWADPARINLARAKQALGQSAEAAALLRADTSPQRFGSRILADRIDRLQP